ncbi:MAG: UvrD-helicase domain-containing protein [Cardiobacteriaceae bacterium]|nr:UvrD-helicase domain-containing protein [Cardiobacteriaceae bacterium]
MKHLNPEQKSAVTHLHSPLLVIAGAGSGKTGVITEKMAYLVREAGFSPEHIYAVTFTNKAAREMQERTKALLGKASKGLHISTFHRLGLEMLKREHHHLGLRPNFTIFDARDSQNLIKELSHHDDEIQARHTQSLISQLKNANLSPELALRSATNVEQQHLAKIYAQYVERLQAYNALDFDDLLLHPLTLLTERADVRAYWQQRVGYLLVDEYQDTNNCQYQLMRLLTGDKALFTAVGDDDQSIYAWRGANAQNILQLHEDYPHLHTIKLEQNYRCDQRILSAANALIANNPHVVEKRLWSTLNQGDAVRVVASEHEEEEAHDVVNDVMRRKIKNHAQYQHFALLYRSNHQARLLEDRLRELRIPYTISGGTSFFEHPEIRDLIAYLRLINNPSDDAAFLRICNTPKREIGNTTIAKLNLYAHRRQEALYFAAQEIALSQELSPNAYQNLQHFVRWIEYLERASQSALTSDLLEQILEHTHYHDYLYQLHGQAHKVEKRLARIEHLKSWIKRLEEEGYDTLAAIMQHLNLMDILERQERNIDAVQLMTLHAAKGLEFEHVYIIGCEEGLLPHQNSTTEEQIQEERRLMYVGMTRAKQTLTLSYAQKRRKQSALEETEASRFLTELPFEEIDWQDGRKPQTPEQLEQARQDFFTSMYAMLNNPSQ